MHISCAQKFKRHLGKEQWVGLVCLGSGERQSSGLIDGALVIGVEYTLIIGVK